MPNTFQYFVDPQRKVLCDWHTRIPITVYPFLFYGDRTVLRLMFPEDVLHDGDTVGAAVDRDFVFWDTTAQADQPPLTACYHVVDRDEEEACAVTLSLESRYEKLRDTVNGNQSVACNIGIGLRRAGAGNEYECMAISQFNLRAIVAVVGAMPGLVLPHEVYPTREEMTGAVLAVERAASDVRGVADYVRGMAEEVGRSVDYIDGIKDGIKDGAIVSCEWQEISNQ